MAVHTEGVLLKSGGNSRGQNRHDLEMLLHSKSGIQLDLGGGANPQHGFVNIDKRDLSQVDIVHDLEEMPWPLPDDCVMRAVASHLVEHINPAGGAFMRFMDEVWRVMKPSGEFMISMPYGYSPGFIQDPTHCNPCNEATWAYFDPLHQSRLWAIYKPKPWYYRYVAFDPMWNMEVLLVKHSESEEEWETERQKWGPMTFG